VDSAGNLFEEKVRIKQAVILGDIFSSGMLELNDDDIFLANGTDDSNMLLRCWLRCDEKFHYRAVHLLT
jgi:hypothetical protein